jgi:singapore isolate B (sub-type 7) whole genome shotgun sequence assembly, scaffold_9
VTAVKETESPVQAQASVEPQQTEEPKPQQTPQESKPQQTATSTDAVDTSLAVLEARCKRFGIPFDPSKYTKRANSRPSKSEVGDQGKRSSVARATAGDATEAVWSAERTICKADGGSFGERPREARGAQKAIWTPVLCFLDTHCHATNKPFHVELLTNPLLNLLSGGKIVELRVDVLAELGLASRPVSTPTANSSNE